MEAREKLWCITNPLKWFSWQHKDDRREKVSKQYWDVWQVYWILFLLLFNFLFYQIFISSFFMFFQENFISLDAIKESNSSCSINKTVPYKVLTKVLSKENQKKKIKNEFTIYIKKFTHDIFSVHIISKILFHIVPRCLCSTEKYILQKILRWFRLIAMMMMKT